MVWVKIPKLCHNTPLSIFSLGKGRESLRKQAHPPTTRNSSIFWMQKDTNFRNTIIIHHLGPENCQNPTQKDTNFGNNIILHYLGPENHQNQTQKDMNFEKLHSLTPAKMPTNKESIRFSRISHHNSNALINPIHTNQPITFGNT